MEKWVGRDGLPGVVHLSPAERMVNDRNMGGGMRWKDIGGSQWLAQGSGRVPTVSGCLVVRFLGMGAQWACPVPLQLGRIMKPFIHTLIRKGSDNLPRYFGKKLKERGGRIPAPPSPAVIRSCRAAEFREPAGDGSCGSRSDIPAKVFMQKDLDGTIDRHFRLRA